MFISRKPFNNNIFILYRYLNVRRWRILDTTVYNEAETGRRSARGEREGESSVSKKKK